MPIELLNKLSSFDVVDDKESDIAFLRTHVPWVAPEAYLNIIYKPAPRTVLLALAERLKMPPSLVELLSIHNGARLFSGSLAIYGVIATGQLLKREGVFSLLPFNIERVNSELRGFDRNRFVAVGGYSFDASTVCIDRHDESVHLFLRNDSEPKLTWSNLEHWIVSEINRLSMLFDPSGRRLVDESETVARTPNAIN